MESTAWYNLTPKYSDSQFDPDLDKYYARIGYLGTKEATYNNLCQLQMKHLLSVPFENVDIQHLKGVNTDPAHVYDKVVNQNRGGYCFELNNLLFHVLRKMGYVVTPMLALVLLMLPDGKRSGRTHLCLKVEIVGCDWLVDVGFGTQNSISPLNIKLSSDQVTSYDVRRIIQTPNGYIHQLKISDGDYMNIYLFEGVEAYPIDSEAGNWIVSTHPESIFTKYLFLGAIEEENRYFMLNYAFKSRAKDGSSHDVEIEPSELLDYLRKYFKLDFPPGTKFKCLENL